MDCYHYASLLVCFDADCLFLIIDYLGLDRLSWCSLTVWIYVVLPDLLVVLRALLNVACTINLRCRTWELPNREKCSLNIACKW